MRCLAQPRLGSTTQTCPNRLHNTRLLIQAPCTSAFAQTPPLFRLTSNARYTHTHTHTHNPDGALAFVPFGIVLVRVRVTFDKRGQLEPTKRTPTTPGTTLVQPLQTVEAQQNPLEVPQISHNIKHELKNSRKVPQNPLKVYHRNRHKYEIFKNHLLGVVITSPFWKLA